MHMLSHKTFEKNVTIMIKEYNVIAIVQKLVITQSYNVIVKLNCYSYKAEDITITLH